MPALIVLQVISSGFGFSRNRRMLLVRIRLHQPVRRRVFHRRQDDRRARPPVAMKIDEASQIDLRQHVAVEDHDGVRTPWAAYRTPPAVPSGVGSTT